MDRDLNAALTDLGLTATEAEIYVALLAGCQDGAVSAYKLAQDMGRDPANMTKTLGAMTKRGAVRAAGNKPRLYQPVPPADFTGALVARLQDRQRQAVAMLEKIGNPPADQSLHTLDDSAAALDAARRLLSEAQRVVLLDASPDLIGELSGDLERLVTDQGALVLARSSAPVAVPGVRVWVTPESESLAPGPWLRLAVDGSGYLEMVVHPDRREALLHGHWSRNPSQAFLGHRTLSADLLLADVLELLSEGASGEVVRRRAEDQAALILRQVSWRQRWREAGFGDYATITPENTEAVDVEAHEIAATMAELAEETAAPLKAMAAADGSSDTFEPETPGAPATPAVEAETDDDAGPLKFIFRRRKNS